MAVDKKYHGKGLGRTLLKDAILRTLNVADIAGIRTLIVHAKDDAARRRFAKWEFEPSPADPYHLFLLLKEKSFIPSPRPIPLDKEFSFSHINEL